jgi:hypothetical protein
MPLARAGAPDPVLGPRRRRCWLLLSPTIWSRQPLDMPKPRTRRGIHDNFKSACSDPLLVGARDGSEQKASHRKAVHPWPH